jgi:hypothetical protein
MVEVRRWILHAKVPVAHFCDDHFRRVGTGRRSSTVLDSLPFVLLIGLWPSTSERLANDSKCRHLGVLLDSQEWSRPLEPITAVSFLHLSSRPSCLD